MVSGQITTHLYLRIFNPHHRCPFGYLKNNSVPYPLSKVAIHPNSPRKIPLINSGHDIVVFLSGSEVKASASNVGDLGSIPGSGRSPGEGNGNPLQYSCLENPWTEEPGGLQSTGSQRIGRD